jgi:DNA-binding NarL/FixJ family response regulator
VGTVCEEHGRLISYFHSSGALKTLDSGVYEYPQATRGPAIAMHSQTPAQAVLLDPHPIWLDAIEIVLERVGVGAVAKTTSGAQAITLVEELQPQLMTLEIDSLPGEPDGIAVLREARAAAVSLRAIVLSRNHETRYVDAALAAGASAYIVKTAHPDDVASAVRQAFDHSVYVPATFESTGRAAPQPPSRKKLPGGLTRRELQILKLAAEGHSNVALARMLWVTEQTVKFHLSNVYRKLEVTNRTEAARWAQVNGLLGDELTIA